MNKLYEILQKKFGHANFREGQQEVIEQIIDGKDVVAILPTGMGKSLLYQLPAYLMEGTVIIVSPLLSLMQDQVEQLKILGEKRVIAINSFLPFQERELAIRQLADYKFIFTSPEMLQNEQFNQALRNLSIAYVVADEAHCISQWGFDFRPDYLRISNWLHSLKTVNVLALTATATKEVVGDIKKTLRMKKPFEYIHSLDRPAIAYEMVEVENHLEKMNWIIGRVTTTEGPGIIYTQSRKKTEVYAEMLREQGISVAYYHAKMEQSDRILIQQQFQQGQLDWICATNAFGMGIHKDNIRQIIHDHIPTSVAGYMQEVGRAARDGNQAIASLLYTSTDVDQTFYVAMQDFPEEQDIHIAYHSEYSEVEQAETTARILTYWKEQLNEQETIQLFKQIKQKKWQDIQSFYSMIQNDICLRQQLLHFFDQPLIEKPYYCCSKCKLDVSSILRKRSDEKNDQDELNWKDRLNSLLPS
ncbi:ATP-dependent DNA helicase RecQ [Psychrobacillus sp. INOP01]|uniref:RecQ family ATP-dependent DNA helicase n=1 Tax=Psychrobacillus sp. INOP01 TaxID=2829187 RepID=UPI001BA863B5|nr:RecQ family ATP-dependent DNA helicase [Psychrobacillus sp. INOP01]QUG41389.1 ATP-dependent DNA helicase RecQ [Psychrobacillus sp. INOP01]